MADYDNVLRAIKEMRVAAAVVKGKSASWWLDRFEGAVRELKANKERNAKRQWVGLTEVDLREIIVDLKRPADLYKAIEAKLKEKNHG
jgi:hypothetical protein